MGRSNKAPAEAGHNSAGLTDDETAALQLHFSLKIRAQQKRAAEAKTTYDLERNEVNALFTTVRAELKYTRKEFEEVLALQDMNEAEFLAHEAKRHRRLANQGLPVGTQLDMFAAPDTVDDKVLAELDGYRAGKRADDPIPPSHISPIFHTDWTAGWHRGQEENILLLGKADEILAERKAKAVELEPEESEDEGEVDPVDAELEAAQRLAESGWTKPTPEEASFGEAAA